MASYFADIIFSCMKIIVDCVEIRITVVIDVTLCSLLDRYQHFGETCCLCLQGKKATRQHGIPTRIIILIFTAMRTWNLIWLNRISIPISVIRLKVNVNLTLFMKVCRNPGDKRFQTLAFDGDGLLALQSRCLTPGNWVYQWIGGVLGLRASLYMVAKKNLCQYHK
jgi:hypothetical protein